MLIQSVFISLLCILSTIFAHVHDCVTPDSKSGLCVKLQDCPKLLPLFENITSANYVYLRRSQCGYDSEEQEVCCPTSGAPKTFELNMKPPTRKGPAIGNRFGNTPKGLPEPGQCGMQTFDNKIFGGEITGIDEFPWMALLEYGQKNPETGHGFACGGALIHPRYVLTAAHCASGRIEKELGGLVSVRLGEHNIETEEDCDAIAPTDCTPPPLDIKVVKKIIHPDYRPENPDQYNDIALLKLAENVEYSDFISPICLAKDIARSLFDTGKIHFVCGWGYTEKGRNSPIKLKLKIPVVTYDSCYNTYSSRFKIQLRSTQVCAGGEGKRDSCSGDSGGPLMVPAKIPKLGPIWFMTGVVSIGPKPCATRNVPGIYTKVSDYYDWIVKNIE